MRLRIVHGQPRSILTPHPPDFSLVVGGPLYQLYVKAGLASEALQLVVRRMFIMSMICWAPLLVISAYEHLLNGRVTMPFLRDPEVHLKFLVALPILIAAEVFVHRRMRLILVQFLDRGIIEQKDYPRFQELIRSAMRLRDSAIAELVLIAVVVAFSIIMWRHSSMLTISGVTISSWYAANDGEAWHLTRAGSYYALVSLSIFRFILLRWYFRLFVWYRFLWQVRGMPLHLNLYHPDQAAGLAFLSVSLVAFSPVFVAQTTVLSGIIFSRILYQRERLMDFLPEMTGAVLLFLILAALPTFFFVVLLERTSRLARREFGAFASQYVDEFRYKWIRGGVQPGMDPLGTPDLQSLADLANSYRVVRQMRIFPVARENLVQLVFFMVLPLLPLTLTVFPVTEIITRLIKMMF
jgi:hypothetical protein